MTQIKIIQTVEADDLFLHSGDSQSYTATYSSDGKFALHHNRSVHAWIFQNPDLLYEGKKCDISSGQNTGYATIDQYGSISVKYWASEAEERKNFVFTKVPKSLREIKDPRTLQPILASLYVKICKNKKEYRPRKKYQLKKDRKQVTGRKVRSIELENYILANLEAGIKEGKFPTRKSTIFLAKRWKMWYGSEKYDTFKVSKGWCDKFMIRNKILLNKWGSVLNSIRQGLPPINSPEEEQMQDIKSMDISSSRFPCVIKEISESGVPADTAQSRIDHALLIKNRFRQRPVREFVQEIAQFYGGIIEGPIAPSGAQGQTCDSDRPRSLSADVMGGPKDNFKYVDSKSDIAPHFQKDLKSEQENTDGKNKIFDQMMNGATEAELMSFVAEVCANIGMLASKYIRTQGF